MHFVFFRLDYCGIAILTMGSFVPWLYYSFYCRTGPKIAYLVLIFVLGTSCIVVSLWDKFSEPEFRGIRAGKLFFFFFFHISFSFHLHFVMQMQQIFVEGN